MASQASVKDPGWATLTDACRLLGVSPSTVRRWGDSGKVRTYTTPGGHRRFSRAGLEAMLPVSPATRPGLAELGETPRNLARSYRAGGEDAPMRIPWVTELDEAKRERFRGFGRGIVASLIAALDADDAGQRAELLRSAEDACANYGRLAAGESLGASMTADVFLRFRRPFLDELASVARRREFDATSTSALIADANAALDDLMLATLRGWEAATLGSGRRPALPNP